MHLVEVDVDVDVGHQILLGLDFGAGRARLRAGSASRLVRRRVVSVQNEIPQLLLGENLFQPLFLFGSAVVAGDAGLGVLWEGGVRSFLGQRGLFLFLQRGQQLEQFFEGVVVGGLLLGAASGVAELELLDQGLLEILQVADFEKSVVDSSHDFRFRVFCVFPLFEQKTGDEFHIPKLNRGEFLRGCGDGPTFPRDESVDGVGEENVQTGVVPAKDFEHYSGAGYFNLESRC